MPSDQHQTPAPADSLRERIAEEVWIGTGYPDRRDEPIVRRIWRDVRDSEDTRVVAAYATADRILALAAPAAGSPGGDRPADSPTACPDCGSTDIDTQAQRAIRGFAARCWNCGFRAPYRDTEAAAWSAWAALGGAVPQPSPLDRGEMARTLLAAHLIGNGAPAQYAVATARKADAELLEMVWNHKADALDVALAALGYALVPVSAAPPQGEEQPLIEGERWPTVAEVREMADRMDRSVEAFAAAFGADLPERDAAAWADLVSELLDDALAWAVPDIGERSELIAAATTPTETTPAAGEGDTHG